MAGPITVPFWPTSSNCLSWSKDNAIAVVGGESVAILTPRLKEAGPNKSFWDSTVIVVNAFTRNEVPQCPLLSSSNFSIGEEIAVWSALQASWSSPGLSRHRGCVLAVLTSNHVLSIWAPDGNPCINTNWHRRIIINHAVRQYYKAVHQNIPGSSDADRQQQAEREQISQRILAFAWSHPLHLSVSGEGSRLAHGLGWGQQYLAIATACGDILIFYIHSPYSDRSPDWGATLTEVIHVTCPSPTESSSDSITALPHAVRTVSRSYAADAIAWSNWEIDSPNGKRAVLAYTVNGSLFTINLRGVRKGSTPHVESSHPSTSERRIRNQSELRPRILSVIAHHDSQFIVAFGTDVIYHIPIQTDEGSATHHLDGRWDDITGVATSRDVNGQFRLHVVSLLSSSTAPTAQLMLPLLDEANDTIPSWQHCLNESKSKFSADLDLEGNVLVRTHGISTSPFSNFIATCSSMHPSDTLGYVIGSDQVSIVGISLESVPTSNDPFPVLRTDSKVLTPIVEPVVFEYKQLIEEHARRSASYKPDHSIIAQRILQFLSGHNTGSVADEADCKVGSIQEIGLMMHVLKLRVYLDTKLQSLRALFLASVVLAQPTDRDRLVRGIVPVLVAQVLTLRIDDLELDVVSLRIQRLYHTIALKLKLSIVSEVATSLTQEHGEECQICGASVPFKSLIWAACTNGHQFSRCGLTFMPIQQPEATKSCGVCGALFLNEQTLFASRAQPGSAMNSSAMQPPPNQPEISTYKFKPALSLAEFLFTACDVCIYCGGRFVD